MKKKHLTFEKAFEILSRWNLVCYTNLYSKGTIIELPMLTIFDLQPLLKFDNWFITSDSFTSSVQVYIKHSIQ